MSFDNSMPTGTPGRISNASSSTVVSDANIDSWSLYGELSIQNGDFAAFRDASNTNYFDVFNSSDSLCIQYNSGGCLVSLGQTGGITTSGTAPTCTVTGAGSGASCTTATGSNDLSGKMIITAQGGSGPELYGEHPTLSRMQSMARTLRAVWSRVQLAPAHGILEARARRRV